MCQEHIQEHSDESVIETKVLEGCVEIPQKA
jgi:hypothetical protein